MPSDQTRGLLYRTILVLAFPPLRLVYELLDVVCFIFQQVCRCLGRILALAYALVAELLRGSLKLLEKLGFASPRVQYKKLIDKTNKKEEPLPYETEFCRRFATHSGGILLGVALYVFVYYVLVKHHSIHSLAVAFILMLPYVLVLENSHSIRAIMMLCLPIMFTNRGRALIFCCMLAIMAAGPLKNSQRNISELHKSLNCSKQYLLLRSDEYVEQNVVKKLMRVEEVIEALVRDIEQFGREIRRQVDAIVKLAFTVDQYILAAIDELKKLVDVCNSKTPEYVENCKRSSQHAYLECKRLLGSGLGMLCELVRPSVGAYCENVTTFPSKFCEISKKVVIYIADRVGERLSIIGQAISNMVYVKVNITHEYSFNGTKSKSFRRVVSEVKFDVEQKFWYIHFVVHVFNLITLILVVWITLTATLYHMHYMDDISYDNMYLDGRLLAMDERRKKRMLGSANHKKKKREPSYSILPMSRQHEQQYLKPFGVWMNEMERHKLLIAGLVWLVIVAYIGFFVALDFGLFQLIELINQILDDILFKSDLPLIDVSSKTSGPSGQVVHYNRTHLSRLRAAAAAKSHLGNDSGGGVEGLYRRLMDRIERNIPDDVMILDSLQQCLPRASHPAYRNYKNLAYLALVTFGGVIIEAYALRLRHWIANLFYPQRAQKRTLWLYRKILAEKPKYERPDYRDPELVAAELLGRAIKK